MWEAALRESSFTMLLEQQEPDIASPAPMSGNDPSGEKQEGNSLGHLPRTTCSLPALPLLGA